VIIRLELYECQPLVERTEHEQIVRLNDLLSTLKLRTEEYRAPCIDWERSLSICDFFFGRRVGPVLSGVAFYLVL